ncbi:MAG: DUF3256 family protein [Prevotella sp.]|nr:DUF3256 family protein [Prevotella sp.]
MRRYLFLLMILLAATTVRAQDAGTLWLAMPRAMTPYLTPEQRQEMLNSYLSAEPAPVANMLHGESSVDTLAADYGRFRLSSARTMQLVRLPREDGDSIVCVIDLYNAPAKKSVVRFYSPDWRPLSDIDVPDFSVADLTARPDSMAVAEYDALCQWFEPQLVTTEYNPASGLFEVTLSVPFAVREEKEKIEGVVCKRFLKWDDKQLKDVTNSQNI